MDNPQLYIYGPNDGIDLECFNLVSNLDYAKEQCIKDAETYKDTRVIYKLVPVFEVELEVTTKLVTRDIEAK